jgi:LuxR family transcriptional regulator, regulator of acetate metabolism
MAAKTSTSSGGWRYRERLSVREIAILQAVAAGATAQQAAAVAGLDVHQASYSLKAASRKLGARSREHAVAIALRLGLIDSPPPPQPSISSP